MLYVKEIHARRVEMCLNCKILLFPSGGAEEWMHLFLRLDRWKLIVDGDGQSSDVGLVIFLHAHACLKNGIEINKEEKGKKKRISFIIMRHESSHVAPKLFPINYLVTTGAVHHWSRRLMWKMRAVCRRPAWQLKSTIPDLCRTARSIAPLSREYLEIKRKSCTTRWHENHITFSPARTSPARSILSIVTFSLSVSRCNFSTTLAYGESIPVMRRMSTLQFFNGKSLRLSLMGKQKISF